MRGLAMVGLALIVVGGTVFLRGLSAPPRREVQNVEDVTVLAEEGSPFTPWASGLAVLAGLALVTTGRRRRA